MTRVVNAPSTTADREPMVIDFPAGIPGFESCRRFVLLTSEELAPLSCLKAVDGSGPTFLAVDPRLVDAQYDLTLREFERVRLGATDEPLVWLALVTVSGKSATVNLRAPIVINPRRMTGCQFIRDDSQYATDASLGGA